MNTAPRYQPHYTVDDYRHWEGRWELWQGLAVAMSPSPFGRHAKLLARTVALLQGAIDAAACRSPRMVATLTARQARRGFSRSRSATGVN